MMTARESEILKKREWSGQMTGFARGPAEPFPGHHARSGPSRYGRWVYPLLP
jgi:hypothetical protein